MQDIVPKIKEIGPDDHALFWQILIALHLDHDVEHYEKCFEHHQNGGRDIILSFLEDTPVGFCVLNWVPKYAPFKAAGLPEIQDLNVLPQHRKQGIGRQMIEFCEKRAADKGHSVMGIGVGMNSSFGSAQRLYVKMGYVPDGLGVNYDRKQIASGEFRPIDDNLCLMMTKSLD